jgi:predicted nucleotidyltransferase
VTRHTVYSAIVGSRAYGLDVPGSDVDRRGVYAAPAPLFWRLDKPPPHVDGPLPEQFSWELERCCVLALRANPTVLECLWSPRVELVTDVGAALLALRPAFLSRRLGETYGNYAADQMARLAAARRRTGEVRWKQAMHMLRLLLAGAHVLRTGEVLVDVSAWRDPLLAVRRGDRPWDEVAAWAATLTGDLAAALAGTELPAEPDRARVEAFLVSVRRASVDR